MFTTYTHIAYTYSLLIYILDFERRVFRELHILSLKLDDISETLNVLIKKRAEEIDSPQYYEVPHIIQLFPLNENSLMELENWLMTSEKNRTVLVKNLVSLSK